MNPVVEAILSRRSVREGFSGAPVPVEVLEDVVRCGLAAPSSKNARPWKFHVVTDAGMLDAIAMDVERSEHVDTYVPFDPVSGKPCPEWSSTVLESAAILRRAPAAVFVENTGAFSQGRSALLKATPEALANSIVGYTFEVLGLGAAVQNMWIAAVAHGLCGVYLGDVLIAEQRIQAHLGIVGDLAGALILGYAGDRPPPASRSSDIPTEHVRWVVPGRSK
jgi:nitroreductase